MNNINIYNDSAIILNKRLPKYNIIWSLILLLVILLSSIVSIIPYNIYKNYVGKVIIDNNYVYLDINIEQCDFPIIRDKRLFIGDNVYKYNIINIENGMVSIKINLEESIKFDDDYILVSVLSERTTILKTLKNKIRKGFGL